jgi:hypothetical protein
MAAFVTETLYPYIRINGYIAAGQPSSSIDCPGGRLLWIPSPDVRGQTPRRVQARDQACEIDATELMRQGHALCTPLRLRRARVHA